MSSRSHTVVESTTRVNDLKMAAENLERMGFVDTTQSDLSDLGIWQTIKDNLVIVLCCICSNIGALMYGFDNFALALGLNMLPLQSVSSLFSHQPKSNPT